MQGYTQGSRCVETWEGAGEEPSCPTTAKHRGPDLLGWAGIFMHGAWSQPRSPQTPQRGQADRGDAQQQELLLRGSLHWQVQPCADTLGVQLSWGCSAAPTSSPQGWCPPVQASLPGSLEAPPQAVLTPLQTPSLSKSAPGSMLSQPWRFPGWQNTLLNESIWKLETFPSFQTSS